MNAQRKRIRTARVTIGQTEQAQICTTMPFDDTNATNIHGVNITMGVSPEGPDETLVGRWYVVLFPPSVASDTTIRDAWIQNLNLITDANDHLDSTQWVWGAGTIVCAEQSTFQHSFTPKTSRNVEKGARLIVIFVADAISGVDDQWDMAATISLFTS